jgi:hypothetical protein
MVDPEDKSLSAMIAKMQEKRAELLTELERVQEWLSQVNMIFNRGKAIIGEESPTAPTPAPPSLDNEKPETKVGRILRLIGDKPDSEKTHADKIRQILEEAGGPLTIPQIDAKFKEKDWPITGKYRNQSIRNNLLRKSTWFVQLEDKTWNLVERVSQDTQAQ